MALGGSRTRQDRLAKKKGKGLSRPFCGILALVSKGHKNQERKRALQRVGGFYKKHPLIRPDVCFYCGLSHPPDIDHTPPLSWAYALGPSWFFDRNVNLWLIPCCRECNSLLGDKPIHTAKDRKRFIAGRLEERYQEFLQHPKWTDDEIGELTGKLRKEMQKYMDDKRVMVRRIAWAFTDDTLPGLSGDID